MLNFLLSPDLYQPMPCWSVSEQYKASLPPETWGAKAHFLLLPTDSDSRVDCLAALVLTIIVHFCAFQCFIGILMAEFFLSSHHTYQGGTILHEASLLQHPPNYVPWNVIIDVHWCFLALNPRLQIHHEYQEIKGLEKSRVKKYGSHLKI